MGRPTDNPRLNRLSVRLNDDDYKKLNQYCEEKNISKTEAISLGINKLK